MLYKFKLGQNVKEATKNICFVEGEGTIGQSIVSRFFKKFCLSFKILNNQIVSGEIDILHFSVVSI